MKILVTGLGGFLGGALGRRLLAQGQRLVTVSRRPLPDWQEQGVEVISGSLADLGVVIRACREVETVYHVAAKAGIWGSYADYWDSNVVGTENVLQACWVQGVTRLVFTSSPSAVFHGGDCCGLDESLPYPENYLNYYSETKALSEQRVLAANGRDGLATVALRPHLIWGPADPHLVPRLLRASRAGRLKRVGDGQNLVDMTYIDNACQAHLAAGHELSLSSPQAGKAYFISNGSPVRLWSWIDQILQELGCPAVVGQIGTAQAKRIGGALEWLYRTLRLAGEPPMTRFAAGQLGTSHYYDISAARRDFGYQPQVSFEEGMEKMLAYFRQTGASTPP